VIYCENIIKMLWT